MNETICGAIRARKLLMFEYADLMRVVEPHLYGVNSAGHDALTAWLRPGHSRTDPRGGWRMYLVRDMHHVQELDERFERPRAGYNPRDERMQRVHCAVDGRAGGEARDAAAGAGEAAPATSEPPAGD
jgi:hypothetical protein